VRAHPGPSVWAAWPLRGNQEAPSQTGGHARCASRNTAFVRAPWVGPPNRASPMRAFVVASGRYERCVGGLVHPPNRASPMLGCVIALGTLRAVRGGSGPPAKQGFAHAWVRGRCRDVRSGTRVVGLQAKTPSQHGGSPCACGGDLGLGSGSANLGQQPRALCGSDSRGRRASGSTGPP
jgi:hypothetical protein